MCITHWKAHLLLLLLLSLLSVSVCLAAVCAFDEQASQFGPLKIVTARTQPIGYDWEPLRIVVSAEDLQGPPKYCIKDYGSVYKRSTKEIDPDCTVIFATVTAEQRNIVVGILERAIVLHTDRLLVQRALGPLVIPDFFTHQLCKYFNVPFEHRTTGVANADMVLYVAYLNEAVGDEGIVSLGVTCAKSVGGRPIAGSLAFGNGDAEINRHTVRLAAHQIAHALGFSYSEMKSRNMIINKTVRDKPNPVAAVMSEKIKQMAQAHYGCPRAYDMELEDSEGNDEKLSHWERRNAKDELMAQPVRGSSTAFMGFYTSLTLAAFEDLGYYKANFQMAEHMEYGYKAGCEFLTDKCMDKGVTKWPNMFCDAPMSSEEAYVCTTDRLGLGGCAVTEDYIHNLPIQFQYFASPNKGGLAYVLTDFCPVVEPIYPHGCTNSEVQGIVPGSLFTGYSMCLDGSALKIKMKSGTTTVGAVCAEISCEDGSVRVKYDGDNNTWHNCPEGQSLTPSLTSELFVSGTITCPKYKEVCTVALDGSSLVRKDINKLIDPLTNLPTGSNPIKKSTDESSVPFGLIFSVVFLMVLFAGFLIA